MAKNTFKKVGDSDQRMYGPRGILACGYSPGEQESLLNFLENEGFNGIPVVFVPESEEEKTLGEFFKRSHLSGFQTDPGITQALILSGISERELQRLLSAFRGGAFPRPLLAALTPTSERWSVRTLLRELNREAEEMRRFHRERRAKASSDSQKGS